jgi:predicted lipoprotein with Yx(FWY)xxD motif
MKTTLTAIVTGFGLLLAATALHAAPPEVRDGVLTDPAGMTLYVFDKDTAGSGKSACTGECLKKWPAFEASASDKPSGDYTVVTRDDGTRQWAFRGKPLYLWVKDQKPGDMTGDGVNNVWHAAKP